MKNIRIDVGNCNSSIHGYLDKSVLDLLSDELSFKVQNCEFVESYNIIDKDTKKRKWDGRMRLLKKGKGKSVFPTGLLHKVRETLDSCEIEYEFHDSRPKKAKGEMNLSFADGIILRDYQVDAVDKCVKISRGIVKAATGAGKTLIAAGIIERLKLRGVVFLAMSGDLIVQARDEFQKFLNENGSSLQVGIVGSGYCEIKDVNVATVQTICRAFDIKYEKMEGDEESFEDGTEIGIDKKEAVRNMIINSNVIIFDEVQHAACETVKQIMTEARSARYRFGLSASPWRDDGADLFIDSQFGKRIVDISASDLIKKGYLVKPYIKMISMVTDRAMFGTYQSIYKNYVVENNKRNSLICKIANQHADAGDYVLILVKQVKHGQILEEKIEGSAFISGSISVKKRKEMLDRLRGGDIKIVIATSVFDEGVDVKRLNCLIMCGSGKSSTRALQRVGRVIRPFSEGSFVKKSATIYDFLDSAKYLSAHARSRLKIYKTESEFDIEKVSIGDMF